MCDFLTSKRVKIGWYNFSQLTTHLGSISSELTITYSYKSHELIIDDDRILDYLDYLKISYEVLKPMNSIKFIQED